MAEDGPDRLRTGLEEHHRKATGFVGVVAPPAMLQTWTTARPRIEGIALQRGSAGEIAPGNPLMAPFGVAWG